MALEIRNFYPLNNAGNVPIDSNVNFDIVATNGDQIDINSLEIEILTTSRIDQTIGSTVYSIIPSGYEYGYNYATAGDVQDYFDAINGAISYSGTAIFIHVDLNIAQPFELGQTVQVIVRLADTNANSMTPYVINFYTLYMNLISDFETIFLEYAQNIPVYHEILKKNNETSPTIYSSAFKNFNRKPDVIVRYNQYIIDKAGTSFSPPFTVDYENGKIIFNEPLDYNDEIDISYKFKFFTNDQINGFFNQASAYWRMQAPFGGASNIYSATSTERFAIMIGAAVFAFRSLILSLAFQEPRLIFDNHSWEDGWSKVLELFKSLSEAYSKDWEVLIAAKKLRLPKIASVIGQDYALPGGRSRMFRYMYKSGI